MCLPFCEQDVKSQFVIIWLIPNVGKYPHRVIIFCGLSYSRTAKLWHFNEDVDEHHLDVLKEAYTFLFGSPKALLQNESGDTCFVICLTSRTFAISADEIILTNTHIDPGQVGH